MSATLACCALASVGAVAQAATQYTYDVLNRLTEVRYDSCQSITYKYDAAGNLLETVKTGAAPPAWCGQTLDFAGNRLPSNWTYSQIRRGPGITNGRFEANPTDSGGYIRSAEGPLNNGVREVRVRFRNARSTSTWGQFNVVEFKLANGAHWVFSDANFTYRPGSREFTIYRSSQPYGSAVAATVDLQQVASRAMGFGEFETSISVRDGALTWVITQAGAVQAEVPFSLPSEFSVQSVVGATVVAYTTTGGGTWIDDLRITCNP